MKERYGVIFSYHVTPGATNLSHGLSAARDGSANHLIDLARARVYQQHPQGQLMRVWRVEVDDNDIIKYTSIYSNGLHKADLYPPENMCSTIRSIIASEKPLIPPLVQAKLTQPATQAVVVTTPPAVPPKPPFRLVKTSEATIHPKKETAA